MHDILDVRSGSEWNNGHLPYFVFEESMNDETKHHIRDHQKEIFQYEEIAERQKKEKKKEKRNFVSDV